MRYYPFAIGVILFACSIPSKDNKISSSAGQEINEKLPQISCSDFIKPKSEEQDFILLGKLNSNISITNKWGTGYDQLGFISEICLNSIQGMVNAQEMIDMGRVDAHWGKSAASALGIDFAIKNRSHKGLLFEQVNSSLFDLGLCHPCAYNAAEYYVDNPDSILGYLIRDALKGDSEALQKLLTVQTEFIPR